MASGEALAFGERVVIVTGAGSGLGREYALQLAGRGARVVANGRSEGNVAETVEMIHTAGGRAIHCVVDITTVGAAERVIGAALNEWGRIDALVNNAGVGHGGAPGSFSEEDFDAELAVSLNASVALSLAAWPHLGKSGAGRIVNTSSATIFGTPASIPYTSAKAAVVGLTRGLAIDGAELGIRANAVMPLASTPMNASLPNKEVARQFRENFPVQKAAALVLLLAHERAPVSGETFVTGGGFSARVSLVVGSGIVPEESSPEGLLESFDDVMSLAGAPAPLTSAEVRGHVIERLRGRPENPSGD
jgi:NAD(P)-dependent dehydrogenase (short-subunit alcohol dehydrogenase family)